MRDVWYATKISQLKQTVGVAVTWYPKPFDLVARKPLETTRTAGRQIYYIWTETGMLFLQSFCNAGLR